MCGATQALHQCITYLWAGLIHTARQRIDGCTPPWEQDAGNYDSSGNSKYVDANADCKDDKTGKAISGCTLSNAPGSDYEGGAVEIDDDYCLPWEEYYGDDVSFRDCCFAAKKRNIRDSGCSAIGISP